VPIRRPNLVSDDELVTALESARAEAKDSVGAGREAWLAARGRELAAECALARARGEQYAEVLDLGVVWDVGAPLPHLLCNGRTALVAFYRNVPDPAWDGSYVTVVDPAAGKTEELGVIEFRRVASVRMGAPNDEAIDGHALRGKGLRAYAAHEVHRSEWLEEHIRVNSVHRNHRDATWRRLHHYLLAFHDEMVECLAREVHVRTVRAPLTKLLDELAAELIGG
jgi:hypothetical protein